MTRTATATDATRPVTLNAERREHWRAHRDATREARARWGWLWRQAGAAGLRLERVTVEVQPSYKGHPADTGACVGSVKAAVDALVDVGGLVGDTGKHVRSITYLAPLAGRDALVVTVREVEA